MHSHLCSCILQLHSHLSCCMLHAVQSAMEVAMLSACVASAPTDALPVLRAYFWFTWMSVVASLMRCFSAVPASYWVIVHGQRHTQGPPSHEVSKLEAHHRPVRIFWLGCSLVTLAYLLWGYPRWADTSALIHERWSEWMKALAFSNVIVWLLCVTDLLHPKTPVEDARSPETHIMGVHAYRNQLHAVYRLGSPDDLTNRLSDLTLRTFAVEAGTETEQFNECAICLSGPYCEGDVVTELHCHHTYHSSCFSCWIEKGGQGCPMRCTPPPPKSCLTETVPISDETEV